MRRQINQHLIKINSKIKLGIYFIKQRSISSYHYSESFMININSNDLFFYKNALNIENPQILFLGTFQYFNLYQKFTLAPIYRLIPLKDINSQSKSIAKQNINSNHKMFISLLLTVLVGSAISSKVLDPENITMTIYRGWATIKDVRRISYDAGISTINFTDVASTLKANTISITPNNSNGQIRILEKTFQFPDQGKYSTLKNYINKTIAFDTPTGTPRTKIGKLLDFGENYIRIQNPFGGIEIYDEASSIKLPPLPGNPISSPTISFVAKSQKPVTTSTEILYNASGLTWSASYAIILSEDQKTAQVSGTITVDNNSGKKYNNFSLILMSPRLKLPQKFQDLNISSFTTQSAISNQIFKLTYPITLNDLSSKQIEFFKTVDNVTISKIYYSQIKEGGKPMPSALTNILYSFNNSKQNRLGLPFPFGQFRVYKRNNFMEKPEFLGDSSRSNEANTTNQFLQLQNHDKIKVSNQLIVVNRTTQNLSTNSSTSKNTSQTVQPNEQINGTNTSNRSYKAYMRLNVSNQQDSPAVVEVSLKSSKAENVTISYDQNYNGLRWDKNKQVQLTIPKNTTQTVVEWIEQGIQESKDD